jgi:pSer/pThr/pTyr-binding forkhead associated (FHA) protein
VAAGEVSRRHAQIAPGEDGYLLTDLSTNGVLVNGIRVSERQVLGRGDVIRIGSEEFRFYADRAKESAAGAPPPASAASTPAPVAAPSAPAPVAPPSAPPPVTAAAPVVPAAKPPLSEAPTEPKPLSSTRTPLATLEVINEGPMKGRMFELYTPLSNVGRGAHNDVAIADDSISDSHAKIVRKEGHWFVMDQGSTNGTYVGGRRVQGEQQLVGAPDVRFGNVKLTFRPSADTMDAGGSTRAIASVNVEQARRMSSHQKAAPAAAAATTPGPAVAHPAHKSDKPIVIPDVQVPEKKKGCAAMIAFVIAAGAAGAGLVAILLSVRG